MLLSLNVSVKWRVKTSVKFNAVAYGKLFKQPHESIVAVGEDGVVQVYEIPKISEEKILTIHVSFNRFFYEIVLIFIKLDSLV